MYAPSDSPNARDVSSAALVRSAAIHERPFARRDARQRRGSVIGCLVELI
jgi:hypothetical protein